MPPPRVHADRAAKQKAYRERQKALWQSVWGAKLAEREAVLDARIAEREAKLNARLSEREAKIDAKLTERQAALEARLAGRLEADGQARTSTSISIPFIPTMLHLARWDVFKTQAQAVLEALQNEMEAYFDEQSEHWPESDHSRDLQARIDRIREVRSILDSHLQKS